MSQTWKLLNGLKEITQINKKIWKIDLKICGFYK